MNNKPFVFSGEIYRLLQYVPVSLAPKAGLPEHHKTRAARVTQLPSVSLERIVINS
jgi:hypothetical protein